MSRLPDPLAAALRSAALLGLCARVASADAAHTVAAETWTQVETAHLEVLTDARRWPCSRRRSSWTLRPSR